MTNHSPRVCTNYSAPRIPLNSTNVPLHELKTRTMQRDVCTPPLHTAPEGSLSVSPFPNVGGSPRTSAVAAPLTKHSPSPLTSAGVIVEELRSCPVLRNIRSRTRGQRGRVALCKMGARDVGVSQGRHGEVQWRGAVVFHNLLSLQAASRGIVYTRCRASKRLTHTRVAASTAFLMLLGMEKCRVEAHDVPRDVAPQGETQWGIRGQWVYGGTQHRPVPKGPRVAPNDGKATDEWMLWSDGDMWHAFLRYSGRVLTPRCGLPRRDVRREVVWHGPTPEQMAVAANNLSIRCTMRNWRRVYNHAVGTAFGCPQVSTEGHRRRAAVLNNVAT